MKLGLRTTASICALALCAGIGSAAAGGVGHTNGSSYGNTGGQNGTSGGYHSPSGGVGAGGTITVHDPNLPALNVEGVTLNGTTTTHNPSPNQPGVDLNLQPSTHNPSPNQPGVDLDLQPSTHNPSPVVPGVNYSPQSVGHNPSPVVPDINLGTRSAVHNPTPVIPGIDLGSNSVTHNPQINIPGVDLATNLRHDGPSIDIPINLPNLNIDISGMVTNVSGGHNGGGHGCRSRCGGGHGHRGDRTTNITITNSVHNETNVDNTYNYYGGSTYYYVEDRTPIYLENFNVEGEVTAHAGLIPLRAVCLDASGNVHPASQVFGEELVDENYSGEIYRCVVGTYMQYTMGEMIDGERTFEHAWSETCQAGDALRYRDGELTCAPQEERRPCNERSLLRRYGPGEKLIVLRGMTMNSSASYGTLGLDGGVGTYRRY